MPLKHSPLVEKCFHFIIVIGPDFVLISFKEFRVGHKKKASTQFLCSTKSATLCHSRSAVGALLFVLTLFSHSSLGRLNLSSRSHTQTAVNCTQALVVFQRRVQVYSLLSHRLTEREKERIKTTPCLQKTHWARAALSFRTSFFVRTAQNSYLWLIIGVWYSHPVCWTRFPVCVCYDLYLRRRFHRETRRRLCARREKWAARTQIIGQAWENLCLHYDAKSASVLIKWKLRVISFPLSFFFCFWKRMDLIARWKAKRVCFTSREPFAAKCIRDEIRSWKSPSTCAPAKVKGKFRDWRCMTCLFFAWKGGSLSVCASKFLKVNINVDRGSVTSILHQLHKNCKWTGREKLCRRCSSIGSIGIGIFIKMWKKSNIKYYKQADRVILCTNKWLTV